MEIDILNSIATTKVHFIINPLLWEVFDKECIEITRSQWEETKFLDFDGNLHGGMDTIPDNKGGIYVFVVKSNIIPSTHMYLLYVGRALNTSSQNLRKRCREYIKDKRPKIERMVNTWGNYLYIRYLPLENNSLIEKLEIELINKLLPPFNERIPDMDLQAAVKAFSA